jgi:hypothetical protein
VDTLQRRETIEAFSGVIDAKVKLVVKKEAKKTEAVTIDAIKKPEATAPADAGAKPAEAAPVATPAPAAEVAPVASASAAPVASATPAAAPVTSAPALVQKKSKGDEEVKGVKEEKKEDPKVAHKNDIYNAFSGHIRLDGLEKKDWKPVPKVVEPEPVDTPIRRDVIDGYTGFIDAKINSVVKKSAV